MSFAYDGAPETPVIDDLSFAIAPGERVAIVGASGAGKSTVFQLIMRFYDCQQGRVMVDGVDVKTVDPAALRERIAPVPQEASIFGGTVSENIAYGRERGERARRSRRPPAAPPPTASSATSTRATRPGSASAA